MLNFVTGAFFWPFNPQGTSYRGVVGGTNGPAQQLKGLGNNICSEFSFLFCDCDPLFSFGRMFGWQSTNECSLIPCAWYAYFRYTAPVAYLFRFFFLISMALMPKDHTLYFFLPPHLRWGFSIFFFGGRTHFYPEPTSGNWWFHERWNALFSRFSDDGFCVWVLSHPICSAYQKASAQFLLFPWFAHYSTPNAGCFFLTIFFKGHANGQMHFILLNWHPSTLETLKQRISKGIYERHEHSLRWFVVSMCFFLALRQLIHCQCHFF